MELWKVEIRTTHADYADTATRKWRVWVYGVVASSPSEAKNLALWFLRGLGIDDVKDVISVETRPVPHGIIAGQHYDEEAR